MPIAIAPAPNATRITLAAIPPYANHFFISVSLPVGLDSMAAGSPTTTCVASARARNVLAGSCGCRCGRGAGPEHGLARLGGERRRRRERQHDRCRARLE